MRIYVKKGAKNYKENRLVKRLEQVLSRKMQENPEFRFTPATDYDELQRLHDEHCVEDTTYEEIKDEKPQTQEQNKPSNEQQKESMEKEETSQINSVEKYDDNDTFIDPLNREEPIVRDYVMSDEFAEEKVNKGPAKTSFEEPKSFRDSFEIPDENTDRNTTTGASTQQQKPKKDKPSSEPVNPNWDEMSGGKKKRSTKKFAKYIVETVCMLSEKGFVWYANKDINDAKLAEYELNDEMDLTLLVSLDEGQQLTVKQFFQMQCMKAEQLASIPAEEKLDLTDALAEVMLEKGIGPTPTQELLLISLKIFGGQVVNLITLKAQTNSLLMQLRSMKEQQKGGQSYVPPPMPKQPQEETKLTPVNEPNNVESVEAIDEEKEMTQFEQLPAVQDDLGIIETTIETKE